MMLRLMPEPDVLAMAYGPLSARPVVAAAAAGAAAACATLAVWLLVARDHMARRARVLFGDDAAPRQHSPGSTGPTAGGPAVRDSGRPGRVASEGAGTRGAAQEGDGLGAPLWTAGFRLGGLSVGGRETDGLGMIGTKRLRSGPAWDGWPTGGGGPGTLRGGIGAGARVVPWRCGWRWPPLADLLRRAVRHPGAWCLMAGTVMAVLGDSALPLLLGLGALPVARRAAKAGQTRRAREQRADEVIALCGALAGEVRAGRHPGEALLTAARDSDGLAATHSAVLAAARFGGDVPRALGSAAHEPGAEGLLGLAACWRVAVDSGAGLAAGLERLEGALRAERNQRADLRAQLAGARSTAALLAGLPVLGLLLGTALGADPLHVLLHTGAGLGCLAVGGVLESVGLWWALRIVGNAEDG